MKFKHLSPDMTYGELRIAYRAKAIALHPDLGGNQDDMIQLNAEYDELIKSADDVDTSAEPEHWSESASDAIKLSKPIRCFVSSTNSLRSMTFGMLPNCQPVFSVLIDDLEEYNQLKARIENNGMNTSKFIMLEPAEFARYWSMRQIDKITKKRKPKQKYPATSLNEITLTKTEDELINLPVESLEEITIDRENIESKLDFNPENLTDARERTNRAIVQRQGQSKFRSELLKAYGGQCAITDCDAEAALEAAHIFPYLGTDTNHVKNGLLLRADIHTLFDLYLISIDPDTSKVVVSSTLLNTSYKELNGKSLKPPQDYAASPSPQALARHYETFLLKQNK
jgi:hypothetical protein